MTHDPDPHRQSSHPLSWVARIGGGRDRDYLIENLSLLIASGMTVSEALDGIVDELHSGSMRRTASAILSDIDGGAPLWRALDNARIFPSHTISLVRVGEESGRLSENLRIVSDQDKKERIFRDRIRSAAIYPAFVLGLTVTIGVGIAWFILPKLATVFAQLKIKLPLITELLIRAGAFLGQWGYIVMPAIIIGIALIVYFLFFFPRTKNIGVSFLFSIPAVRELILETELARFGYLLGTLIAAGLPIIEAIESVKEATQFSPYRRFYTYLARSVEDGNSFEKSFATYPRLSRIIPKPVQQLIVSAERSGNLSKALVDISARYEAKSETTTKDLSVILEPILLVIVWLGVVAVALAVILPVYSLIGGLEQ